MSESSDATVVTQAAFEASVVTNFTIAAIVLFVFSAIRDMFPHVYLTRESTQQKFVPVPPPKSDPTFFGWLWQSWNVPDEVLLKSSDLDAYIYLRFFRLCFRLFAGASVIGIGIVLPVNYNAANPGDSVDGTDRVSMSNVPEKSSLVWIHFLFAYGFSAAACVMIYRMTTEWLALRIHWLRSQQIHSAGAVIPVPVAMPDGESMTPSSSSTTAIGGQMTVMVRGIPKAFRTDDKVFDYFSRLYGATVRSATVCRDVSNLDTLVYNRSVVVSSLQDAYDAWSSTGVRPMNRPGGAICCCKAPVDTINTLTAELERLNADVERDLRLPHKKLSRGFVTFLSSRSVSIADSLDHSKIPERWATQMAPNPGELYWPSLSKSPKYATARKLIVSTIIGLLILFWAIPIAFISTLVSLDKLEQRIPALRDSLAGHDTARAFLSGFLGSVVYVVFQLLLPTILDLLARIEGVVSESAIQKWILRRYFLFIVINFFFGIILTSSLVAIISDLSVSKLPTLLGQAVPSVSMFFVSYILLRALAGYPLFLLRPGAWIVSHWLKLLSTSKRQTRYALDWARYCFYFGSYIPETLLVFLIGCTYTILSPLILPFLLLYFGLGYVTNRYMFLYVIVNTDTESGGSFWPLIFSRICASLIFSHITLIGVFSVKLAVYQSTLMLPLPILTYFFYDYVNTRLLKKGRILALEEAQAVDDRLKEALDKAKHQTASIAPAQHASVVSPPMLARTATKEPAHSSSLPPSSDSKVDIPIPAAFKSSSATPRLTEAREPVTKVLHGGIDDVDAQVSVSSLSIEKREQILCEAYINPSLLAPSKIVVLPPTASDQSALQSLQLDSLQHRATNASATGAGTTTAPAPSAEPRPSGNGAALSADDSTGRLSVVPPPPPRDSLITQTNLQAAAMPLMDNKM